MSKPGPVSATERYHVLDVLRGTAVLGILVTNIQHFAMFAGTTRNPTLWGDLTGENLWVYSLTFTLFYQKFLPIFSMLFGAGIVLSAERRERAGLAAGSLHYRRMVVLLLIGLLHGYLIWYGDILFVYAVCGMVIFAARRLPAGSLIALGIAMLAVHPLIEFARIVLPMAAGGGDVSIQEIVARDLAAFRGGWLEQLAMRAEYSFEVQTRGLLYILFWRAGGIMLLGMALYKLGVLTAECSRRVYFALIAVAVLVALPATLFGLAVNVAADWQSFWLRKLAEHIIFWFGIPMSLALASVVMLACGRSGRPAWSRPLAAVGRMALTCYLLESVICTFIFYGHGLALYGRVERTGQAAVVLGVWALLLVVCPLWLRFFRFGPAEWAWRALAYNLPLPNSRSAP